MRRIRRIICHHTLTPDGDAASWPVVWDWHTGKHPASPYGRKKPALDTIAYHAGVELIRGRYMVLLGRPIELAGVHAPGANHDSLGVCFVGDFTNEPPPDEQIDAAVPFLATMCRLHGIDPRLPSTAGGIHGHGDVTPGRPCPGAAFPLLDVREAVARALGV